MNSAPLRVLVTRTDHLGDVILSIPMVDRLKSQRPNVHVTFLVSRYTAPLMPFFPQVDDVLFYDDLLAKGDAEAVKQLRDAAFDVVMLVNTHRRVSRWVKGARIPQRIGTSRRMQHWWCCNRLIALSRKRSSLHEAQLNLQFLAPLGIDTQSVMPPTPSICPHQVQQRVLRHPLAPSDRFQLVLHPGSNQNTCEWASEHVLALVHELATLPVTLHLTGTAKERERFSSLGDLALPHVVNHMGKTSFDQLVALYAQVNGYISVGTGTLHLAAAMGVPVLGLYPLSRITGVQRWRPLGPKAAVLVSPDPCVRTKHAPLSCRCMDAITVSNVREKVAAWVVAFQSQTKEASCSH